MTGDGLYGALVGTYAGAGIVRTLAVGRFDRMVTRVVVVESVDETVEGVTGTAFADVSRAPAALTGGTDRTRTSGAVEGVDAAIAAEAGDA